MTQEAIEVSSPVTTKAPVVTSQLSTKAPVITTPGTTNAPESSTVTQETHEVSSPVTTKAPVVTSQLSTKAPVITTPGTTNIPESSTVTQEAIEISSPVTKEAIITTPETTEVPEILRLVTSMALDTTAIVLETTTVPAVPSLPLELPSHPIVFAMVDKHITEYTKLPTIASVFGTSCNGKDFICENKSSFLICSEDAVGVFRTTDKNYQDCPVGFACDNNAPNECSVELSSTTVQQGENTMNPVEATTTIEGRLAASETTTKAAIKRKRKLRKKTIATRIVSTTVRTGEMNTTVI